MFNPFGKGPVAGGRKEGTSSKEVNVACIGG